jgi:probable RNA-binding protein EIF1AD
MTSRKGRLAPSKNQQQEPDEPPAQLSATQFIAKVVKVHGNALYTVELSEAKQVMVELPVRFRKAVWVRRGGFVLVDTDGYVEGKVQGKIEEVIIDERAWRKTNYWWGVRGNRANGRPQEFTSHSESEDSDEENIA